MHCRRDLCQGANFYHIFEMPDPDFSIHFATFMALKSRRIELPAEIVYYAV